MGEAGAGDKQAEGEYERCDAAVEATHSSYVPASIVVIGLEAADGPPPPSDWWINPDARGGEAYEPLPHFLVTVL
jgi:hypothetical protein